MVRVVILATLLLGAAVRVAGADAPVRLTLLPRVDVHADIVRIGDLAAIPLPAELAGTVLCAAPAPGHARNFDRASLVREMLRAGVRPLPVVDGAQRIEIRRPGRTLGTHALDDGVRAALAGLAVPTGALDHRFTLHGVEEMRIADGPWRVRVDGAPPRVGRGSVAIELSTADGSQRRFFVAVTREVRVAVLRSRAAIEANEAVRAATVVPDTLWTDQRTVLDGALPTDAVDGSLTLRRSVPGGHVLLARDVRPTPVVRRGELVDWTVTRGSLQVRVTARSRGDGAIGDWILVESPFDRRLRRVCVIGPHRVADHPPRADDVLAERTPGGTP